MQWFNLHLPLLKSDEFSEAEPWEIGVWLRLMAYCCEQENGGQILGCADWSAKKWLITCGVEVEYLKKSSQLWTWAEVQPGVLWVHQYPNSREDQIRKARFAGRKGGGTKSTQKVTAAQENGKLGGRPFRYGNSNNPSITQRKGKGKDKVIPLREPELEPDADADADLA